MRGLTVRRGKGLWWFRLGRGGPGFFWYSERPNGPYRPLLSEREGWQSMPLHVGRWWFKVLRGERHG